MARVTITIEGPNFIQTISRGNADDPSVLPTLLSVTKTCISAHGEEWPVIREALRILIDAMKAVNENDDTDLRDTRK